MKKLVLSLAVVGLISFTACKKTAEGVAEDTQNAVEATTDAVGDAADATADAVEGAADAVEETVTGVPQFENADVQKFVDEYSAYYKEVVEATKSGDAAKVSELQANAAEWGTKMAEMASKLSAEDQAKLSEWAAELAKSVSQ